MAPERVEAWLAGFAERHGGAEWSASGEAVTLRGEDGCSAECMVPFPPLDGDERAPYGGLVAHAARERVVGVLLVRLGGYAVGVFEGRRLVSSKVGSRPVHGRAAAGGWSQQRFARRRENQAHAALQAAAEVAERILIGGGVRLEALVVGGDRHAVETVLSDPRLAPLRPLRAPALLDVPTPDRRVLESAPERFRAVRIRLDQRRELHDARAPS